MRRDKQHTGQKRTFLVADVLLDIAGTAAGHQTA